MTLRNFIKKVLFIYILCYLVAQATGWQTRLRVEIISSLNWAFSRFRTVSRLDLSVNQRSFLLNLLFRTKGKLLLQNPLWYS